MIIIIISLFIYLFLQDSFRPFTLIGLKIRLEFMWTVHKKMRRMKTALTMIMKMWSSLLRRHDWSSLFLILCFSFIVFFWTVLTYVD